MEFGIRKMIMNHIDSLLTVKVKGKAVGKSRLDII